MNWRNMEQYDYSKEAVYSLLEWAKNAKLPKEVKLSKAEHIIDSEKFIRANIYDIEAHFPDSFYNPAIDRLYRLKQEIEKNEVS